MQFGSVPGPGSQLLGALSPLVSHVTESDPSWQSSEVFASSFCLSLLLLWAELWWGMGHALLCDSVGEQGTSPFGGRTEGQGGRKEACFSVSGGYPVA